MTNKLYKQLPNGDWANQSNPGGPVYFSAKDVGGGNSDIFFTYDGQTFFQFLLTSTTQAAAQAALNNYIASLEAGTA